MDAKTDLFLLSSSSRFLLGGGRLLGSSLLDSSVLDHRLLGCYLLLLSRLHRALLGSRLLLTVLQLAGVEQLLKDCQVVQKSICKLSLVRVGFCTNWWVIFTEPGLVDVYSETGWTSSIRSSAGSGKSI